MPGPYSIQCRLPLLGVVFILAACTFTLKDKFINPAVQPPEPTTVTVDILDPTFNDPYFLAELTTFTFKLRNFPKVNQPTARVTVSSDNVFLSTDAITLTGQTISFQLSPFQFQAGTHLVTVSVTFPTGSGSLAELEGLEQYRVDHQFQILVDNVAPTLTSPLTASIVNGYLQFEWGVSKPYSYRYRLDKWRHNGPFIGSTTFNAAGPIAHAIDSGYVGGWIQYSLIVYTAFGETPLAGTTLRMRPGYFNIQQNADSVAILNWTPNFSNAYLTLTGKSGTQELLFDNGTAVLDTIFLGDNRTYNLNIRRNAHQNQGYDSTFVIADQPSLTSFFQLKVLGSTAIVVDFAGDATRRSVPSWQELQRFSTLHPGLAGFTSMVVNTNSNTVIFGTSVVTSTLDFTNVQFTQPVIEGPTGGYTVAQPLRNTSLSTTQLVGLSIAYNGSPRAAIVDMTQPMVDPFRHKIIWMDSVNQDAPIVSSDGNWFCLNQPDQLAAVVYKKTGATWTPQGKVPPSPRYFRNSGNELVVVSTSGVQVFSLTTPPGAGNFFVPLRSFTFPNPPPGHQRVATGFDDASDNVWVETLSPTYYSTIRAYTVTNFAFQEKATAYVPPERQPWTQHGYSNHYHFVTQGYVERIP